MTDRVSGAAFLDALTTVEASAWRWECQGVYREPAEAEPLRKFLEGEEVDHGFMDDWLAMIRRNTEAGKTYGRVRVLTEPLTDYLRFELSFTHLNVQAGEDVRVMTAAHARELDLPEQDFWLLDNEQVLVMHFGADGFDYADVVTDPAKLGRFREIRDLAWKDAERFDDAMT